MTQNQEENLFINAENIEIKRHSSRTEIVADSHKIAMCINALHDRVKVLEAENEELWNTVMPGYKSPKTAEVSSDTEKQCTHNYGAMGVGCMPWCKDLGGFKKDEMSSVNLAKKLENIFNDEYIHRPTKEKHAGTWNTAYSKMAEAAVAEFERVIDSLDAAPDVGRNYLKSVLRKELL